MRLPGHRKKLLREGAEGHAVVLESQGVNIVAGGASAFKLLLEVHFSDGSTAELRQKFNLTDARVMISVGDILPIHYDPEPLRGRDRRTGDSGDARREASEV